jgi:hypothetical protein
MGRPRKSSTTETRPGNKNVEKIGVKTIVPLDDEGRTFFLQHVRRYPFLWNCNHPYYRQEKHQSQALTEIGRELYVHSYTDESAPISKLKNTLTLLKSVYRKKKRMESLTDELMESCSWLRTIDEFLTDDTHRFRNPTITSITNFSLEDTLKLLNFYKSNDCLWNPKHPMYRNRNLRSELWKNCAAHMNKTAEDCNKMIQSLRHRYISKRDALRAADVPAYCKKLEWFSLCESFLGPLLYPQGGQSKKVGNHLVSTLKLLSISYPSLTSRFFSLLNKFSNFGLSVEETIMDEELEPIGPIPSNERSWNKADKRSIYLRFLKLFQKFEVLWNHKHPSFGNDFYRDKAWTFYAKLIRIEGITPKYCKEKVKNIRRMYIFRRKLLNASELEVK